MKKIIISILIFGSLYGTAYALPTARYEQDIYPFQNGVYDLGTSTLKWLNGYFNNLKASTTLTVQGTNFATTTIGDNNAYITIGRKILDGTLYNNIKLPLISGRTVNSSIGEIDIPAIDSELGIVENTQLNTYPTIDFIGATFGNDGNSGSLKYATDTASFVFDKDLAVSTLGGGGIQGVCVNNTGLLSVSGCGSALDRNWTFTSGFLTPTTSVPVLVNGYPYYSLSDTFPGLFTGSANGANSWLLTYASTTDTALFSNATGGYNFDTKLAISGTATSTNTNGWDLSGGCFAINSICIKSWIGFPTSTNPLMATYFVATSTTATSSLPNIDTSNISAINSAGFDLHSNNGTNVALFGAGGGSNATFYGGVNIDGATRLATSLTGFLKATAGVVSTSLVDLTTDVTGILPLSKGGTATSTFQNGSVVFSDGTKLTEDRPNLNWDDTNNRLGIGTSSPYATLSLTATQGTPVLVIASSTAGSPDIIHIDPLTGYIGLGESNPQRRFVLRDDFSSVRTTLALYNADLTNNNGMALSNRTDTNLGGTFLETAGIRFQNIDHDFQTGVVKPFVYNNGVLSFPAIFDYTNNVGIGTGTSTPWGLLSVHPNGISGPSFVVGSSTKTDFIVTNGGNAGIGSTTPFSLLSVGGDVWLDNPSSATTRLRMESSEVLRSDGSTQYLGNISGTSLPVTIRSGGADQIYINNSTGNIGLGTTTPNRKVVIWKSGVRGELLLSDGSATVDTSAKGGTYLSSDDGFFNIQGMNSQGAGTSALFTIDQVNATVGIGSSTPLANLQVTNRTANATTSLQFGKPNQNKGTCLTYYDTAGSPVYMYIPAGATTFTAQNGGTAPSGCKN